MTIVEGVGWVLLHFVWEGTVIALALAVLLALTRDGQARLRYALSCGALTLMLVAALATAGAVMSGRAAASSEGGSGRDASALGLSMPGEQCVRVEGRRQRTRAGDPAPDERRRR